ncbi:MAG: 4Fe-4S dicluster domain-containing protein [Treponema sp.]|nr:4Fe-4S dicluster domain-containing protein [Treponema sp.]
MKSITNFVKDDEKDFSESVNAFLPQSIVVPVNRLSSKNYKCVINVGDTVREGQLLAVSLKNNNHIDSAINAPLPGTVVEELNCTLPDGRIGQALKIKLSGSFSYTGKNLSVTDWKSYSDEELLKMMLSKGVVNTFTGEMSLVDQIINCKVKHGRYLVVRMYDEDPSRKTDYFVASKYTREVLEGAAIVAGVMKAQGIIFLVPKKGGVNIDNDIVRDFAVLTVDVDTRKYPCGFVQTIIPLVKKSAKNTQIKLFDDVNAKSIFVDPETLYSVYEAIVLGKPVTERFVHVSGASIYSSAVFKVKIGTSVENLASYCGGYSKPPAKTIINGMIVGTEVDNTDVPVTKFVKSVMFVPRSKLFNQAYAPCIRCGKCRRICPEQLYPDLISYPVLYKESIETSLAASIELCSQCGLCNSVCPSRIPLSQIINYIREEKNEK